MPKGPEGESLPEEEKKSYLDFLKGRKLKVGDYNGTKWVWKIKETEQEQAQWQEKWKQIKERKIEYQQKGIPAPMAQSMAYLNDPQLGPLLVTMAKKDIEIQEREDVWGYNNPIWPVFERSNLEDLKERQKATHSVLKPVINKILKGELLTSEDYQPGLYLEWQQFAERRPNMGDPPSLIWHWLVQFTYDKSKAMLPNILSISMEEAVEEISSFTEETFSREGEIKFGAFLAEEYESQVEK